MMPEATNHAAPRHCHSSGVSRSSASTTLTTLMHSTLVVSSTIKPRSTDSRAAALRTMMILLAKHSMASSASVIPIGGAKPLRA